MNWPPATRRLVMETLHQVQRRSGNSAVDAEGLDWGVDVSAMVGILAKGSRVCQCASSTRNFGDKYLQGFKRSVYCNHVFSLCLLYTSDAADERSSVDLGGRRIIKKKKKK